jgi:catechol 2,3-dioxygenase-like lactoylglutathione lyase family enzyme
VKPEKKTQVRHVGIVVQDLDRSLWFYQKLLGLDLQRRMMERGPGIESVLSLEGVEVETVKLGPQEGGTLVELLKFHSHTVSVPEGMRMLTAGPTHVAFTVDDLRTRYFQMKAQGIEFTCPPQISPDGKVLLTYCQDPDGSLIELVEIL